VSKTHGNRHSAKIILYSAKPLPNVTLDKEYSANILFKWFFTEYFFQTRSKDFTECRKTIGKLRIEKIEKKTAKHFLKL
jgi:hypothetical protein